MEPYTKPMIQHDIVQGIIKGEYLQTGLLSERQLMEKFGVSKSIVREALVELCSAVTWLAASARITGRCSGCAPAISVSPPRCQTRRRKAPA